MDRSTVDLTPFEKSLCHAIDRNDQVECSQATGYQLDDADGLAVYLGFHHAMVSKVDYFNRQQTKVILIEMTDLATVAEAYHNKYQQLRTELLQQQNKSRLSGKEKKEIRRKAWQPVTNEFKLKWAGSIAVIERLLRKNGEYDVAPNYSLMIVCKNDTDITMLDSLSAQLSGMMGVVKIYTTETVMF